MKEATRIVPLLSVSMTCRGGGRRGRGAFRISSNLSGRVAWHAIQSSFASDQFSPCLYSSQKLLGLQRTCPAGRCRDDLTVRQIKDPEQHPMRNRKRGEALVQATALSEALNYAHTSCRPRRQRDRSTDCTDRRWIGGLSYRCWCSSGRRSWWLSLNAGHLDEPSLNPR
jgi:hypothetical protein